MMPARYGMRWSSEEEDRLRRLWGVVNLRTIATRMQRPPAGVRDKAIQLGLPCGISAGCISLAEAARRAGYYHESFRRAILWWISRGHSPEYSCLHAAFATKAAGKWRQLDEDDAAEIARAYAASELPGQAEQRLGISSWTLRRRAIAAGHRVAPRQQLRLLPEEWDAVAYPTKGPQKCPHP